MISARETLVLVNPHAAAGRAARQVPQLRDALRSRAVTRLEVADTVDGALAFLQALPEGSRIVLVGGDGTLHRMLPALLARRHELALLPCGTGNDGARALGLHRLSWQEALALGLDGTASDVDTGEVVTAQGRWPFFSSLAAGFDAAVSERALRAPDLLRGTLRYLWSTFGELRTLQPAHLAIQADGRAVHDGPALFASSLNTRSYGSGMPAVPHARIDDGRLDLLLAGAFGRASALAMLPLLLAGLHLRHPRVRSLPFERLEVHADRPLALAADGDPLPAATHFEVLARPASLRAVRHGFTQGLPAPAPRGSTTPPADAVS